MSEFSNEELVDNLSDFNSKYMELALKQAQIGKDSNEVPVGCIIVENNKKVIASAHNKTNITKNATKHCEIICIEYLASKHNIYELSNLHLGDSPTKVGGDCGAYLLHTLHPSERVTGKPSNRTSNPMANVHSYR